MEREYAPIIFFTYARPDHLQNTVNSVLQNEEAKNSDAFFFSDAAKNEEQIENVNQVRSFIHEIQGFKSVHIIERKNNWGLRKNILDGVTEIVNLYGSAIVLEDDVTVSKYFLKYMNDALYKYKEEKKVMQIVGCTLPYDRSGLEESYFTDIGDCYGWATWIDRWNLYERNPEKLVKETAKKRIYEIDKYKFYPWSQVMGNYDGTLDSWAVFWLITIMNNHGLVLYPREAMARTDFDETGTNNIQKTDIFDTELASHPIEILTDKIDVCSLAEERTKKFYIENDYTKNNEFKAIISKVINKARGRKIAIWGMGSNGKRCFQELCAPEYQDFEVELFDNEQLKQYYADALKLKKGNKHYFIIVSMKKYENVRKYLIEDGYIEQEDFVCIGELL